MKKSLFLLLPFFLLNPLVALATTVYWTQDQHEPQRWSDAKNWSHERLPSPTDHVIFAEATSSHIRIDGSLKAGNVSVATPNAGLLLEGESPESTLSIGTLIIGANTDESVLRLSNLKIECKGAIMVGAAMDDKAASSKNRLEVMAGSVISSPSILSIGREEGFIENHTVISDGGRIEVAGLQLGNYGSSSKIEVRGEGSTLQVIGEDPKIMSTLGLHSTSQKNSLRIHDKGAFLSNKALHSLRGVIELRDGRIDLLHGPATSPEGPALYLGKDGSLVTYGGSIRAGYVRGDTGANVEVKGILQCELEGAPGWDNSNLNVRLSVRACKADARPGIDYDFLEIDGAFRQGGTLTIDTTEFSASDGSTIHLIRCTRLLGGKDQLKVAFEGPIQGDVKTGPDGIYVTFQ